MSLFWNNTSLLFKPPDPANNVSSHKEFVFSPIGTGEKVMFCLFMCLLCCFAIFANAIVLYFSKEQQYRQRMRRRTVFNRSLSYNFIKSVAWIDFCCAIVIPPVFIVQLVVNASQKEWSCKSFRYLSIVFPTITLNNLVVMGIERYLAVFYPFFAISNRTAKKLIVIAWISGGLITLVPMATYKVIRQDLDTDTYTLICKYDKTVPAYRIMIMGFTLIVYIIPSIILTFTSIRIVRYLSKKKLLRRKQMRSISWSLKTTIVFVKLTFSFVIPYFLYVVYVIIYMAIGEEIGYKDDYIIRRCSAIMAFSNTVVNPIILYFSLDGLRQMLRHLTNRFYLFIRRRFYGKVFVVNEYKNRSPGNYDQCNQTSTRPSQTSENHRKSNEKGVADRSVIVTFINDITVF